MSQLHSGRHALATGGAGAALILSACATLVPARCTAVGLVPEPALTCDMAIGASRGRLMGIGGVDGIEVWHGGVCDLSPNGRCPFMDPSTSATIVVDMARDGDLMFVISLQPDGTVVSGEPRPRPVPVGPGVGQP
jgi:hypothetical protein